MTDNRSLQTTATDQVSGFILTIRATPVLVDADLATLFGVTTKALNQAVQRNIERFPAGFKFQLAQDEKDELVTNCDRFKKLKHSSALPHAFTEQGVAMISAVLKNEAVHQIAKDAPPATVQWFCFLTTSERIFRYVANIFKTSRLSLAGSFSELRLVCLFRIKARSKRCIWANRAV